MTFPDYAEFDGIALAALIRRRELSARDVTDAAIARIEALNPALNAVVTKLYDYGRNAAKRARKGPLFGVPFLLKDISGDLEGVETRRGSRFMSGWPAPATSTLTKRQEEAGLIVLGKTNVPEFGMSAVTDSVLYGPARNPWSLAHTAGGSSGGAAAAVASGMVPIAHGGDAGGSIRMPASACGLVGLKPTRGRNPSGPIAGELLAGYLVEHVLTRSVRDSAAVLDCTHGHEAGDPYFAPPIERPFLEEVGRDPGKLRIAFCPSGFLGAHAAPDCVEAVEKAAHLLGKLGHDVEEASPPAGDALIDAATQIGAAWIAAEIDAHARVAGKTPSPDNLEPHILALHEAGRAVSAPAYVEALQATHRAARGMARFMKRYDVWMSPVLGAPPELLGAPSSADANERMRRLAYVLVANATGQPSVSLPLHWTNEGLPIGVLFTGRFGDEATLFRLSAQLEQEKPWAQRRPPIWGTAEARTQQTN